VGPFPSAPRLAIRSVRPTRVASGVIRVLRIGAKRTEAKRTDADRTDADRTEVDRSGPERGCGAVGLWGCGAVGGSNAPSVNEWAPANQVLAV